MGFGAIPPHTLVERSGARLPPQLLILLRAQLVALLGHPLRVPPGLRDVRPKLLLVEQRAVPGGKGREAPLATAAQVVPREVSRKRTAGVGAGWQWMTGEIAAQGCCITPLPCC